MQTDAPQALILGRRAGCDAPNTGADVASCPQKRSKLSTKCCLFLGSFCVSITLALCGGCTPSHPAPSPAAAVIRRDQLIARYGEIQDVTCSSYFNDLLKKCTPPSAPHLVVTILNTNVPLALSPGGGSILISKGLINAFSNEAEMVFMLTHEIGHYALGHHALAAGQQEDNDSAARRDLELSADRFAVRTMTTLGYDPSYSVQALKDVYVRIKDKDAERSEYPSLQERIVNLAASLAYEHWAGDGLGDRRAFHECRTQL